VGGLSPGELSRQIDEGLAEHRRVGLEPDDAVLQQRGWVLDAPKHHTRDGQLGDDGGHGGDPRTLLHQQDPGRLGGLRHLDQMLVRHVAEEAPVDVLDDHPVHPSRPVEEWLPPELRSRDAFESSQSVITRDRHVELEVMVDLLERYGPAAGRRQYPRGIAR
jgi:hypothetical protein